MKNASILGLLVLSACAMLVAPARGAHAVGATGPNLEIRVPSQVEYGGSFEVRLVATTASSNPYIGWSLGVAYDGAVLASPPTPPLYVSGAGLNDAPALDRVMCSYLDNPPPTAGLPPTFRALYASCETVSGISGITTATPLAHLTFTAPTTAGVTYFHLITGGTYTSNADGTVAANTFSCGPLPPYPTGNCGPLPNPPFPLGTTATDTSVTFSDCPIARADLNGDGIVTIGDFGLEALYFGQALPPAPSRDDQSRPRDNMITIGDFGMMATVFGKNTGSCP